MGAEIAQPVNPLESDTLSRAIQNVSLTISDSFWIGKIFDCLNDKKDRFFILTRKCRFVLPIEIMGDPIINVLTKKDLLNRKGRFVHYPLK